MNKELNYKIFILVFVLILISSAFAPVVGLQISNVIKNLTIHNNDHITNNFIDNKITTNEKSNHRENSFTNPHFKPMAGESPGTFLINETTTQNYDFQDGTFDQTIFDSDNGTIILDNTLKGNYTSQIFNANQNVKWNNITWTSNGIGELPNNQQIEKNPNGTNMTDNTVLYHFNNQTEYGEDETTLYDFSNTGHDGTLGAILIPDGKIGGGVEFNGIDSHIIYINDGMEFWDNAENWSVAMWIYARDTGECIINKRDDIPAWIWIGEDYRIGFSDYYGVSPPYIENVSSTLPYAVDPNTWTYLTLTRNNTNLSVYKNGVLHTNLTASTSQNGDRPGLGDLQIGRAGTSSANFDGLIDELAFFTRTLSYDEIWNMYTRGLINLNLSVSSCDDPNCIGETWNDLDDIPPQDLYVDDNQYFQYKFMFETENLLYTPELYNVTIYYSELDIIPPEIINVMDTPDPQDANGYVNITCEIIDNYDVNIVKLNITYPSSSHHNVTMQKNTVYYYNQTYTELGTYYYFIWANDTRGNSNSSNIYNFVIQSDTTPPGTITNLQNTTGDTWINWTWNNPTDLDFNHTMVYLNDIWITNTSNQYYNATSLSPGGLYEIGTQTVDQTGNINTIWINQTTQTLVLLVHNIDTGRSYPTIQEAIDSASTINGNTILVDPGVFTENIDVYKSLTIRSTSGSSIDTIVEADTTDDYVFEVTADYVNISGFTIQNATMTGMADIYILNADNCNISNNYATNSNNGIYLHYSNNNTIINNNITESDWGIALDLSNNNTIINNNATDCGFGIGPRQSCNNTIMDNIVYHNSLAGIYLFASSNNNTIANNTANRNNNGVLLRDSRNNIIMNNIVTNNNYGITLQNLCNRNTIYNNLFRNPRNAWDDGNNIWNITKTSGINIINGIYLGGNYWCDYNGIDIDNDGLGDTNLPYNCYGNIINGGDYHPLNETQLQIININLKTGWNLITIPLDNNMLASNLAENVTGCISINTWDEDEQRYYPYFPGGPPSFDYALTPGRGYFVETNQDSVITITGNMILNVNIPIKVGWNMIGWYHDYDTPASSIAENITGCLSINRWDKDEQRYYPYFPGGPPSFDFTITQGMGLFIEVDQESIWHGEG